MVAASALPYTSRAICTNHIPPKIVVLKVNDFSSYHRRNFLQWFDVKSSSDTAVMRKIDRPNSTWCHHILVPYFDRVRGITSPFSRLSNSISHTRNATRNPPFTLNQSEKYKHEGIKLCSTEAQTPGCTISCDIGSSGRISWTNYITFSSTYFLQVLLGISFKNYEGLSLEQMSTLHD